jgi:hypothetical protein
MSMTRILAAVTTGALLWSCTTDLEVNAPYKNITIVYGLLATKALDGAGQVTDETRHWLKINKAFLGEGDAFVFASIPDSNEFTDEQLQSAVVEEWDGTTLVNTFPLLDTLVDDRVPGVFNYPVHKLYYFDATLDQDHSYKVVVVARGETTSVTTPIVNDFLINSAVASPTVPINIMTGAGDYGTYDVRWSSGRDGRRWEIAYRVNYSEVIDGDTIDRSFTQPVGYRTCVVLNNPVPEDLNVTLSAQNFYQNIRTQIDDDPGLTQRIFHGVDLLFAVASDDFHTYLQLSDPISGIVEERPDYTNVTNGYGLVGSRYFKQVLNKRLGPTSTEELVDGDYTGGMLWCVSYPSSTYQCD